MFRKELLKEDRTVINCRTQEQANTLGKWLEDNGLRNISGSWPEFLNQTCFRLTDSRKSSKDFYIREGFKVLSYEDALDNMNIEKYLVVGNVVWIGDAFNIILPDTQGDLTLVSATGNYYHRNLEMDKDIIKRIYKINDSINYFPFFNGDIAKGDYEDITLVWEKPNHDKRIAELQKIVDDANESITKAEKELKELR